MSYWAQSKYEHVNFSTESVLSEDEGLEVKIPCQQGLYMMLIAMRFCREPKMTMLKTEF